MKRQSWRSIATFGVILVSSLFRLAAEETGLRAAKDIISRLVPCTIIANRLAIDGRIWEKGAQNNKVDSDLKLEGCEGWPLAGILFQNLMNNIGGGMGGGGSGIGGDHFNCDTDCPNIFGLLNYNSEAHNFDLIFREKVASKLMLSVADDPQFGLSIRYADAEHSSGFVFVQERAGLASLVAFEPSTSVTLSAADFSQLVNKDPQSLEHFFFRPLADIGIDVLYRYHPRIMAAATAYTTPPRLLAEKINGLVKALGAEQMDDRDQAARDLARLFPQASAYVEKLGLESGNSEVKHRIDKMMGKRGMNSVSKAEEYVKDAKLRDDRAYLLELMQKYPAYKAGAQARLAELYGKDYGDNAAAWPKP